MLAEGEGIEPPAAILIAANGFEVRKAHQSLSASKQNYNIKEKRINYIRIYRGGSITTKTQKRIYLPNKMIVFKIIDFKATTSKTGKLDFWHQNY